MMKKIKYCQAVISGYEREDKQSITVYFYTEHAVGRVHTHSMTFDNYTENEEAGDFFENLPIFTKSGEIDFDSLPGIHVCLKFAYRENRMKLVDAELDSLYYAVHPEEEQEWI